MLSFLLLAQSDPIKWHSFWELFTCMVVAGQLW
jgi:hypothetical protein